MNKNKNYDSEHMADELQFQAIWSDKFHLTPFIVQLMSHELNVKIRNLFNERITLGPGFSSEFKVDYCIYNFRFRE